MFPEPFNNIFFWAFNLIIAFISSFLGSLCIDILAPLHSKKRKKRISTNAMIIKGITFSFFTSIVLAAVYDKWNMGYPLYVAIAGCIGGAGDVIYKKIMNENFITRFIKKMAKNSKNVILKSIHDALEEDDENEKDSRE